MNVTLMLLMAVAASLAAVLFLYGYRQVRTDAMERLSVEDLPLLRGRLRRRAEGESPLQRLARRQVVRLRRLLGPRRISALQRLSLIHISEPTRLGMISYA